MQRKTNKRLTIPPLISGRINCHSIRFDSIRSGNLLWRQGITNVVPKWQVENVLAFLNLRVVRLILQKKKKKKKKKKMDPCYTNDVKLAGAKIYGSRTATIQPRDQTDAARALATTPSSLNVNVNGQREKKKEKEHNFNGKRFQRKLSLNDH